MARFTQASLAVLISIFTAALVVAFVLPIHARGGTADQVGISDIRHALLIEETARPLGETSNGPTCPFLAQRCAGTSCPITDGSVPGDPRVRWKRQINDATPMACPFLAPPAARSGCPAPNARTELPSCPYMSGSESFGLDERANSDGELRLGLTL